jgi:ubiquinone biosynthesis protein UbiJ
MIDTTSIEEKLSRLENAFIDGPKDIVREIQLEILHELYKIRDSVSRDLTISSSDSSEHKKLESEVRHLRDDNDRLKYRIEILKRNVK